MHDSAMEGVDVSIHNLRTVAPRYGELLALLVYLTWWRLLVVA